jgi:Ca2+-binding EF-hand superfamily protein
MSKKVLLVAGVLLAGGSVAAISSPYFRGTQQRLGELFADSGDDDYGSRPGRSGKRHRQMDADDDGRIDKAEFGKSRHERFAKRNLDDRAEEMPSRAHDRGSRRHADRARDPEANEGETGSKGDKGATRAASEPVSSRHEHQFSRLDSNGDGFIDAKEYQSWVAERSMRAAQRFLKRFDVDGDGKVSKEEFRQFAKDRPTRRDTDSDDQITEAELPPLVRGRGIVK